ncbi:MAG: hypothetical protein HC802_06605 [Caldilineaceae bacterium]|nr:hypothetical protein [Caldilineaceae bacterium]
MAETNSQTRAKEERVAELTQLSATLKAQLLALDTQEEALGRAISGLQGRIDPAEAELTQLESEQAAEEERERIYQQTLRTDESAWNAAQLQHQRTEDALRQMRHEIEQDLGLVLLEESEELAYQPPLPWETIVEQLSVPDELPDDLEKDVREMRARLSR